MRKKKLISPIDIKKMRSSLKIKKLLKKIKSKEYIIDKSIEQEIKNYTIIGLDKINPKISSNKEIVDLNEIILKTQSYKDRVTSILVPLLKIKSKLKRRREEAVAYLWNDYYEMLSYLKTESSRVAVINQVIAPLTRKLEDIRYLVNMCETIQQNLTSASFALKEVSMLVNTSMTITKHNNL